MALFVTITESKQPITQWNIGVAARLRDVVGDSGFTVSVQADGDELAMIQCNLDGIRKAPKQRVVTWHGDDARFIVENL